MHLDNVLLTLQIFALSAIKLSRRKIQMALFESEQTGWVMMMRLLLLLIDIKGKTT